MSRPNPDMTAGVEPTGEEPGRNSPASSVCYMNMLLGQEPTERCTAPSSTTGCKQALSETHHVGAMELADRTREESDSTPRSEVHAVQDAATAKPQPARALNDEPGYFSPRPLRMYSRLPPASTLSALSSTDPSPTSSQNASSTSMHNGNPLPPGPAGLVECPDRPRVQRDCSSTLTASGNTVRPHSVDPVSTYTPPSRQQRDGPHYPNQSYAALQLQQYPTPYAPNSIRARTSHASHHHSLSVAHITTLGLQNDHHRDIMETGSRTVGNSPASSPGLFSPTTPPLRHTQNPDEQGYYSSPYLHHTHRQAPKETHVADVDVDPISGRKIINQYEVIDELGRGMHGKVKLGRNLDTGIFVAIKIVDRYSKRRRLGKSTSHEDKIKREIAILKKARHPNIVSLLEVIDDPKRKKVYIILEHVELGEVKWRTEGTKEVALVEWRRYERESRGEFDNESALMEDERIIATAHQRLAREQRRHARRSHLRRLNEPDSDAGWSLEHQGDSDDEYSETRSRTSTNDDNGPSTRHQHVDRPDYSHHREGTMETAFRSTTPTASSRPEESQSSSDLAGTMYGAYEYEQIRGRTPSLAGSTSSYLTEFDEIPEHFRYVPLMTMSAARDTFRDTVLGLEYLHYQGVIHRDIKPANLLQTKEHRIKISDFGVSYLGRQQQEDSTGDQSESDYPGCDEAVELAKTVGTPAFYAPELCRTDLDDDDGDDTPPPPPVDGKIDVWALGVTLYCLIFGRVPFLDHNTFHLMKLISDTELYVPRYRLKAVAEQSGSRPSSHGRMYHHSMTSNKRAPHDLEYEEVDDNLRDLLSKLFIKDPRRRISIKEIKRHPWLLQGIDNSHAWVEETDPGRNLQGKRIEVSRDDVERAVVPITLIDRVRSGVRRTLETLTRMGTRGGSRRRAQSSATSQEQPPSISANSSSSTISQESRRPSLAMNQSIFEALSRSREVDHPLSQSVTASPESSGRAKSFENTNSRKGSPAHSVESSEYLAPLTSASRPAPPERAYSTMSSTASIRTVRPSDMSQPSCPASPNIPPALPGTPTVLDTPGGSNLGGIFGGVPRRLVNSVRTRERTLKPPGDHTRAKSIEKLVCEDDAHSGPSIALSTALAAGHVDPPDVLKDLSPIVPRGVSPNFSELQSPDPTERASSRQSSISSASSRFSKTYTMQIEPQAGSAHEASLNLPSSLSRNGSETKFSRAKDEFVRRRVVEETQARSRPSSMSSQPPPSALSQAACPPSPDDDAYFERQMNDYIGQRQDTAYVDAARPRTVTSSSSEDHFATISQSTSNPSIPSVASANSSIGPEDCMQSSQFPAMLPIASADSMNQFLDPVDDPAGYDGDHPLESGEDDSSEEEEDFLVMSKKKPAHPPRGGSISNAELARANVRKEIMGHRRRSTRSGSNGTVKKIRPPGDSDDEHKKDRASGVA